MKYCCNYPMKIRATEIAVATGTTTITIPSTVTPAAGVVYDVILSTPIHEGTEGTQLVISNGTIEGTVYKYNGNYARVHDMSSRSVLRVQFFDDPEHFMSLSKWGLQ